jgi:uncharacterized membrane protein
MDPFWSLLTFLGSAFCHQIPDRSYALGDLQMPLCARCIGLQFGFLLSSIFLWTGARRFASGMPEKRALLVLSTLFLAGAFEAVLSYSGLSESDNLRRTISGLLIGTTVPFVVVPLLNKILFAGRNDMTVFKNPLDWAWLGVIFIIGGAAILLATYNIALFYAVSVLGIVGMFVFSLTMVTLLVTLLTDGRKMARRSRIMTSMALTVAFILLLATVHSVFFPQI